MSVQPRPLRAGAPAGVKDEVAGGEVMNDEICLLSSATACVNFLYSDISDEGICAPLCCASLRQTQFLHLLFQLGAERF